MGWKTSQTKQQTSVLDSMQRAFGPFNAFSVSEYRPQFDIKPFAVSNFTDRSFTSGSAVIEVDSGEYRIYNPGGETCRLESAQRGRYEPGMEGVAGVALRKGSEPTGTTKYRWGYFDTTNTDGGGNGFGFEEDANGLRTFVISDGTTTYTGDREDWLDPLDGSGPSGYNVDTLDGYIYQMPFLWYGYGPIKWGILITPKNKEEKPYLAIVDRYHPESDLSTKNPNLPVTVEISGDSEGEVFVSGRQFGLYGLPSYQRRVVGEVRTAQTVPDTGFVPTISGRLRLTYPWVNILVQLTSIALQTDADLDWYLALGGSLDAGATWNVSQFANANDTAVEFSVDASSISGQEIFGGPGFAIGGGGSKVQAQEGGLPRLDAPIGEIFTLMAKSQVGTANVRSALQIAELR